jgi:hypothetical protein
MDLETHPSQSGQIEAKCKGLTSDQVNEPWIQSNCKCKNGGKSHIFHLLPLKSWPQNGIKGIGVLGEWSLYQTYGRYIYMRKTKNPGSKMMKIGVERM